MKKIELAAVLAVMFALLAGPASAGELALLGGYGWTNKPVERTYAWQVQYMEGLGEHLAYSISYMNQGHFISHHRDANTASLWLRTNLLDRRLSLGVGGGGLFYYDTIRPADGSPPQDFHGWGTIASVAATWYTESRWFGQLQGNWVRGGQSFDTLTAVGGIGYELDAPPSPGPDLKGTRYAYRTTENELTLFGGETIVNIPGPGHSRPVALEYRRGIWRFVELSVRGLYEGRSDLIDRYGVTTQLWLAKPFLQDRIALGAGFGGYFAVDERRGGHEHGANAFLSEVASLTASVRISQHWLMRATWDRIITTYNRDSDIFLGGIGYRF